DNDVSLAFRNGSRIVGLPGKEETVRGFSAVSMLVIDEASRVEDVMYEAVRPMLAISQGSLWVISTPFAKQGFFWKTWERGGPEWEKIRMTAAECPRFTAAFLQEEMSTLGEYQFRREYCCEFSDIEGAIFDRALVESAFCKDIKALDL